jgi:muconolactone delta-isomerase
MEFLVNIEINWPPDGDPKLKEELFAAELVRGQELSREGKQRRLWRVPGRWDLFPPALPLDGRHGSSPCRARE